MFLLKQKPTEAGFLGRDGRFVRPLKKEPIPLNFFCPICAMAVVYSQAPLSTDKVPFYQQVILDGSLRRWYFVLTPIPTTEIEVRKRIATLRSMLSQYAQVIEHRSYPNDPTILVANTALGGALLDEIRDLQQIAIPRFGNPSLRKIKIK